MPIEYGYGAENRSEFYRNQRAELEARQKAGWDQMVIAFALKRALRARASKGE